MENGREEEVKDTLEEKSLKSIDEKEPKKRKRKWKNKKKDPTSPKHPRTAYTFFSKEMNKKSQEEVFGQDSSATIQDVTKYIAQHWKRLPEEEREMYNDLAKQDKIRYQKEMEEHLKKQQTSLGKNNGKLNGHKKNNSAVNEKVLLIRRKGDPYFERFAICEYTIETLMEKIKTKLHENREIQRVINLPNVIIRDTEGVILLTNEAELEVTFAE